MVNRAVTELVVSADGALATLDRYEDKMEAAGRATTQSTGALDRFNVAMQRARDAQEKGLAIQTESIQRRSAEQRALERWQGHVDQTMRREIQLRREAERAAVDMSNAVILGYTSQEEAVATLTALESRHATELRKLAAATNAAGAANDNLRLRADATTAALHRQERATASTAHTTNLLFQAQDIAMMTAMGQAPHILALQQGTQVAGIFHQIGGGRQVVEALKGAIIGLINPLSLATIGIIGLGAAAAQYFTSSSDGAAKIEKALERHAALLKDIENGYGLVVEKIKAVSRETSTMMTFRSAASAAELEFSLREATARYRAPTFFKNVWDKMPWGSGAGQFDTRFALGAMGDVFPFEVAEGQFKPFEAAILGFFNTVRDGAPDVERFRKEVLEIWRAEPNNDALSKTVRTILDATEQAHELARALGEAKRARDELMRNIDSAGRLRPFIGSREDMEALRKYTAEQETAIRRMRDLHDADMQAMRARSPDELAAAARAREEAIRNDEESAALRRQRIDLAGAKAAEEATYRIAEALRERVEAERQAIAQMELDIVLIGRTAGEAARLSTEYDLLRAAKEAAHESGVSVEQDEIERIRRHAAEVGKLAEEYAKLQALDDIGFDRSLIGLTRGDQQILSFLRQIGIEADSANGQMIAGQLRYNQVLSQTRDELEAMQDVGKDAFMSIIDLLYESGDAGEKLIGIFANISKQFAKMGMERLWKSWTEGSMFDGMTGGATGSFSPVQAASVGREIGQAIAPSITSSLNDNLTSFAAAIRKVESGSYAGNYGAVGPMVKSGSYAGDHAYGAYQVMGRNIESWTKEATGTALSIQEFLDSKSAQDRVFANKFGQSVEKFGTFADGASVWFSGRPLNRAGSASDGYNTVPEYVQKAEAALAGYNPSAMRGAVKGGVLDAGRAMQYDSFQDRFDTGAPTVLNQRNLKDLLGVGGAAFGAFAGGYQSGSPIGGALSGAMAGFGAAPMLANLGLGAAAGPVGLIGGAIIGLIGGILGKSKQKKEEMRKAQQELESQMGAITELIATATGNFMGAFEKSLMSTSDEFAKAIALAEKARNAKLVGELKDARDEFFRTMEETWSRGFEGMIASMNAGLGLDGEFLSGMDAVEKMRESLVGFVNDAKMFAEANGDIVGYMENARKDYETGTSIIFDPTQMSGYRGGATDISAEYRDAVKRWAAEIERYQIDVFTPGVAPTRDNPSGTPVGQVYDSVEALRSRLMDFGVVFDDLGQIVRETTNEVDLAASVERAREAAIKSALAALSGAKEFTEMEKAVLRLEGAAASLPSLLDDLGMSAEEAAAAIDRSLIVAMDKLRMSMETDLLRSINELSDMGFMNDLLDAQTSLQTRLRDAQASGADVSLVFTELGLRLRQIAGDAELTDDQLRQLADVFPMLSGELMGLIGMSAGNTSAAVSAAKAALDEAKANLRSAYEEEKRLLEQVVSRHDALIKSLQRFRDDLRLDANLSPLDPYQRMLEAQKQFQETAALALTGDEDALGRLEDVSRAYLTEARSYYATSEGYYSIFTEVESILDQALSLAGDQLSEAERQLAALDAQVSELITLNDTALTVVDAINALADAEAAHAAAQAAHASAQDQRISDMMKLVAKMVEDQKRDADYRVSPEVEKIYQDIVGRFPEKDGADYWQRIFDSGMDVNEIYRRFIHDVIALGATPNPSAVAQYGIGDVGSNGLPGYSSGGFTGFGGLNQVMGVVHGQEFVAHAEATRRWRPQLEAMNAGSYRGGGQDNAPLIAEIRALRQQVADLERSNAQVTAAAAQEQIAATEGTTQAVNRQATSQWQSSRARRTA